MFKSVVAFFLVVLFSVPAFAKPHDVYPVPCDAVWTAIKATLGNENDYKIVAINDYSLRASFVVVGSLKPYTNNVGLSAAENGCAMKLVVLQVGSENSDEMGFRKRLGKALAKLQAAPPAKPAATATP